MSAGKFALARCGDLVFHDPTAPSGVIAPRAGATVFVEGTAPTTAAATVGTPVQCGGTTAGGPIHPPGIPATIATGSATVFVDGLPAARWSPSPDLSSCAAMLGDPKQLAGRTTWVGG